jgi:chloramphenicol-sensitive protein RarD
MPERNRGALYASGAFALWGILPVYLRALGSVAPTEVLVHRIVWLGVFLALVLTRQGAWTPLVVAGRDRRTLFRFASSALLLSINWFLYIWSVNAHRVVDASLGYFINPLVNVLLGVAVLGERLRRWQWASVALAGSGVAWLTWVSGSPPWIGLSLAATFGIYGLLRKTAALGALHGLAMETAVLLPIAVGYFVFLGVTGQSHFVSGGAAIRLLLVAAGPVTGIPLLLFAAGARLIPLSLLGLLQYIGPTLQLVIGLFLWHEPFVAAKAFGYSIIWAALALYTAEAFVAARRKPPHTPQTAEPALD